jgi:hypothetical protein
VEAGEGFGKKPDIKNPAINFSGTGKIERYAELPWAKELWYLRKVSGCGVQPHCGASTHRLEKVFL